MSQPPKIITVIGSLNIDLVTTTPRMPAGGETISATSFTIGPGGKGANQAVACARLSRPHPSGPIRPPPDIMVKMIGSVGRDSYGITLVEGLKKNGVDTSGIKVDDWTKTGNAIIIVEENTGENRILLNAGANGDPRHREFETAESLGTPLPDLIVMQLEIPLPTVVQILTTAKEAGVDVLLNPAPAVELSNETYPLITHLIVNESEAAILSKMTEKEMETQGWNAVAEKFFVKGVKNVVITLGAKGAFFATKGQKGHWVEAEKVLKVVDTTAAGDTFVGAYAVNVVRKGGKQSVTEEDIRSACRAAGRTVEKKGAQSAIPWADEAELSRVCYSAADYGTVLREIREAENHISLILNPKIPPNNRKLRIPGSYLDFSKSFAALAPDSQFARVPQSFGTNGQPIAIPQSFQSNSQPVALLSQSVGIPQSFGTNGQPIPPATTPQNLSTNGQPMHLSHAQQTAALQMRRQRAIMSVLAHPPGIPQNLRTNVQPITNNGQPVMTPAQQRAGHHLLQQVMTGAHARAQSLRIPSQAQPSTIHQNIPTNVQPTTNNAQPMNFDPTQPTARQRRILEETIRAQSVPPGVIPQNLPTNGQPMRTPAQQQAMQRAMHRLQQQAMADEPMPPILQARLLRAQQARAAQGQGRPQIAQAVPMNGQQPLPPISQAQHLRQVQAAQGQRQTQIAQAIPTNGKRANEDQEQEARTQAPCLRGELTDLTSGASGKED